MLLGLVSFPRCFISTNPDSCMLPGVSFLAGSMRVAWLPNAVRSFSALGGPFWARISLDIWRVRALEGQIMECFDQQGKQCSHDTSAWSHCFPHINADNVRGADEHIFASGRSSPLFGKHRVWTAIFVSCHSKHATKHKTPLTTRQRRKHTIIARMSKYHCGCFEKKRVPSFCCAQELSYTLLK